MATFKVARNMNHAIKRRRRVEFGEYGSFELAQKAAESFIPKDCNWDSEWIYDPAICIRVFKNGRGLHGSVIILINEEARIQEEING